MKKFNYQFYGSHVGRMNYGGAKFCRFALFPLMLLMLLLLPTRMVAETTTEDPRCALFKGLEGISDVTFIDNGEYPWQMLDLNAEGMSAVSSYFTNESTGLMSSNYTVNDSKSEIVVKFKVEKPILFSFKCLISAKSFNYALIYLNGKELDDIRGTEQKEYKSILNKGEYSLTLSYYTSLIGYEGADRAFIYDLNTATTIDDNVADYDSSNNTLTFKRIKFDNLKALDLSRIVMVNNEQAVSNMCSFLGINNSAIKSVVFDKSFNTYTPTSLNGFFENLSSLQTITDLEYLNTANVTDMSYMFSGCNKLSSLDLTSFKTANVTDMNSMFLNCSALTTIYASDKFVTGQVNVSYDMFADCNNLIGAIKYDESKTDRNYANYENGYFSRPAYAEFDESTGTLTFKCGTSIPEGTYMLNVGKSYPKWYAQRENIKKVVFDASLASTRATNCYAWFSGCKNLTTIEGIEYLNTEKVTDMCDMFYNCFDLTSLDVSNFDTQKVTDMSWMFDNCVSLTSLDVSNFNTQNVENMSFMFSWCEGLNSLDLSKFDTQNVTNMSYMFWNSSALTTIYVSDKFVTDNVSYGSDMFTGCEKLKGFIEQNKNTDKIDHTYANYKTGYFTKLVGKNGEKKIGAAGETLATDNLVLADGKDFVVYETFAAKDASYSRTIKEGSKWGTLCLPFAIDQSQETGCKFYRFTGIDDVNDCITLESCEEGKIPAGTPVLFKMNENEQTLSISVQNAGIVKEPVAGTNTDVNLVGSFTKIGGKDNQGLAKTDYIIGKDKFWLVSDLNDGKGVGIKPMHAYIHPTNVSQARVAMLSIGKGDGTTAIDNLNAISNDANAEYYDANGRRTNGLQKGLNIVKRGSKTYKIMVK